MRIGLTIDIDDIDNDKGLFLFEVSIDYLL